MILSISNVCTFDRFGRFRYLCIFFSSLLMKISRLKCPNLSNVCCADAQKSLITIAIYIYIYIYIYISGNCEVYKGVNCIWFVI